VQQLSWTDDMMLRAERPDTPMQRPHPLGGQSEGSPAEGPAPPPVRIELF